MFGIKIIKLIIEDLRLLRNSIEQLNTYMKENNRNIEKIYQSAVSDISWSDSVIQYTWMDWSWYMVKVDFDRCYFTGAFCVEWDINRRTLFIIDNAWNSHKTQFIYDDEVVEKEWLIQYGEIFVWLREFIPKHVS